VIQGGVTKAKHYIRGGTGLVAMNRKAMPPFPVMVAALARKRRTRLHVSDAS